MKKGADSAPLDLGSSEALDSGLRFRGPGMSREGQVCDVTSDNPDATTTIDPARTAAVQRMLKLILAASHRSFRVRQHTAGGTSVAATD